MSGFEQPDKMRGGPAPAFGWTGAGAEAAALPKGRVRDVADSKDGLTIGSNPKSPP